MLITRKQLRKYLISTLKENVELASSYESDNFTNITNQVVDGKTVFTLTSISLAAALLDVINRSDVGAIGNITEDIAMLSTLPTLKPGSYVNLNTTLKTENSPAADIGDTNFGTTNNISGGILTIPGNSWSVKSTSAASGGFDTTGRALMHLAAIAICKNDPSYHVESYNNQLECIKSLVKYIEDKGLNEIKINFGLVYYKWKQGGIISKKDPSSIQGFNKPIVYRFKMQNPGFSRLPNGVISQIIELLGVKNVYDTPEFKTNFFKLIMNNIIIELAQYFNTQINPKDAKKETMLFQDEIGVISGEEVEANSGVYYIDPDKVYNLLYGSKTPLKVWQSLIESKKDFSGAYNSLSAEQATEFFTKRMRAINNIKKVAELICKSIFKKTKRSSKIEKQLIPIVNLNKKSLFSVYHADAGENTWSILYSKDVDENGNNKPFPHKFTIIPPNGAGSSTTTHAVNIEEGVSVENFINSSQIAIASSEKAFNNSIESDLNLINTPANLGINPQPAVEFYKTQGQTETQIDAQIENYTAQNQELSNYLIALSNGTTATDILKVDVEKRKKATGAAIQTLYVLNDKYLSLEQAKGKLAELSKIVTAFNQISQLPTNPTTMTDYIALLEPYNKALNMLIRKYQEFLPGNQADEAIKLAQFHIGELGRPSGEPGSLIFSPKTEPRGKKNYIQDMVKDRYKAIYRIVTGINDLLTKKENEVDVLSENDKLSLISSSNLILQLLGIYDITFNAQPTLGGSYLIHQRKKTLTADDFLIPPRKLEDMLPENYLKKINCNFGKLLLEADVIDKLYDITSIFLHITLIRMEIGILALSALAGMTSEANTSNNILKKLTARIDMGSKTSHGNEIATTYNLNTNKDILESKLYQNILFEILKYSK